MKLKVSFKNGDNEQSFQLAGDPGELFNGIAKCAASVVDGLKNFVTMEGDEE